MYKRQELTNAIQEIANHNYEKRLELNSSEEFSEVSKNFNRMAKRLEDYHASTLSDMMASKKYMETIINKMCIRDRSMAMLSVYV